MAAPLLPPAPRTPLKSTRTRSRLRSNTFSLSSPPSYSGRSLFGSSPTSVKTHHRGGSSALIIPDGTVAHAQPANLKTRSALPSSARGHTSRPSIGTPFAPTPRQLNAPKRAPPLPPLMPVPLCTPPLQSPSATSTVFGFPFPEQPKLPASTSGNTTATPPKHQRPPPLRRRSSSSGSFRSALAVEFDNAVRKRDEESASSSFSLQNRQLWADALFLRLCSRPSRIATSGAAQPGPNPIVVPAPSPSIVPAVMSPPLAERNSKEIYRKREGSSSLGRFKKPAALGHRSSKTISVDITRGADVITSSLPPQEGSPQSTRLHRRRPSMPNVPSSSAMRHESYGPTTKSMPVPRLPEWACVERAARKSEETSRSPKEAIVATCAPSRGGASSDVAADAEWKQLKGVARTGHFRLAPLSNGQGSSVSSGDSPIPPSPLTPSTPSAIATAELSGQTEPIAPLYPSPAAGPVAAGRRRVEQRVSLPERGPRRSRAHTMGSHFHTEEVASMSTGLGVKSGLLPNLMPVLFPVSTRPGSLRSMTMQSKMTELLPSVDAVPEREQESLLLDVLKAGSAYKSLPPSPTSPLSTEASKSAGIDASGEQCFNNIASLTVAKHSDSTCVNAHGYALYAEPGQALPVKSHEVKLPSLPSKDTLQALSPVPLDGPPATARGPLPGTSSEPRKHRSPTTSLSHLRRGQSTAVRLSGPPSPHCRASTGKRSTSSREGDSSPHEDDGAAAGKTARRLRSSPRKEQEALATQSVLVGMTAEAEAERGVLDDDDLSLQCSGASSSRLCGGAPAVLFPPHQAAAGEDDGRCGAGAKGARPSIHLLLARSPAKRQAPALQIS